jgi:hypothetical protein
MAGASLAEVVRPPGASLPAEGQALMCTISGTCGCQRGSSGFALALTGQVAWWLLKTLAQAVQLLILALILTGKWAAPRAYRLARSGYRAGRRRWLMRPLLLDREPAGALPVKPTAVTLADLKLKEPANS